MRYKTVILTEKASQAKSIAKAIGAKYIRDWYPAFHDEKSIAIVPLKGHVLENLEPKEYGPEYEGFGEDKLYIFPQKRKLKVKPELKQIFEQAKKYLLEADEILVASDMDNEGAAIAFNVLDYLGVMHKFKKMIPMGSMHEKALRRAIEKEKVENFFELAAAGNTRSFIDWAEGMSLSRALTYYLGNKGEVKLLFGGVKAPIVYIVVMRELERAKHKKSYYWTAKGTAVTESGEEFEVVLKKMDPESENSFTDKFESEEEIRKAIELFNEKKISVERKEERKSRTAPPKLYELTSLQNDVGEKTGIKPSGVMEIAQKLYEHEEIQTYPRTDIPYLKEDEYEDVPVILELIKKAGIVNSEIVDEILSGPIPKRKTVFNNEEVTAHGAIVPTTNEKIPEKFKALSKTEQFEFSLVAKRYTANFMPDYEYLSVKGNTEKKEGEYALFFSEHVPLKSGWKKVYNEKIDEEIAQYKRKIPASLQKGDVLFIKDFAVEKKETKPKPFFTIHSLNKACSKIHLLFPENEEIKKYLKDVGIGTVATRAKILDQLMDPKFNRGEPYLVEIDGKIRPTKKAIEYVKLLPPDIVSPIKRALLQKKLRMIEKKDIDPERVLDEYREEVRKNIERIKRLYEEKGPIAVTSSFSKNTSKSLGKCPICNGEIIEKKKVYYCSNAKFEKTEDGKIVNRGCPYMIFKNSLERFGKKEITPKEVERMLSKGKTSVTLKSQRTGKPYSAYIVPDQKYGVKVDFSSLDQAGKNGSGRKSGKSAYGGKRRKT